MPPRLLTVSLMLSLCGCTIRPVSAQSRTDAAFPSHADAPVAAWIAIVTVSQYLAVGWAETPILTIDGASAATTATIYIPAGRGADPSCWRGDAGTIRVGDRYRLSLEPAMGASYSLHVRIHDHGATTYWAIRACESLPRVSRTTP